jgi:hypothetical protein
LFIYFFVFILSINQRIPETTKNASFAQVKTTTINLDADCYKKAPLFYYIFYKNFMVQKPVKYTLSSAIFFVEQNKNLYETIICESNTSGWQQLNKPYLKDGEPVCGEGTTKYE